MRDIKLYEKNYCEEYDFEKYPAYYRKRKILEILNKYKHSAILKFWYGLGILFEHIGNYRSYYAVAPSKRFYDNAVLKSKEYDNVVCINDFFRISVLN